MCQRLLRGVTKIMRNELVNISMKSAPNTVIQPHLESHWPRLHIWLTLRLCHHFLFRKFDPGNKPRINNDKWKQMKLYQISKAKKWDQWNFQDKAMRSPMKFPGESSEISYQISKGKQWDPQWNFQGKAMKLPIKFPRENNEIINEMSRGKQWNCLSDFQKKAMKLPKGK